MFFLNFKESQSHFVIIVHFYSYSRQTYLNKDVGEEGNEVRSRLPLPVHILLRALPHPPSE